MFSLQNTQESKGIVSLCSQEKQPILTFSEDQDSDVSSKHRPWLRKPIQSNMKAFVNMYNQIISMV